MTKIVADDGQSSAEVPVDIDVRASVNSIFDGHDFSDEFKDKIASVITGLIDSESKKRVQNFKEEYDKETEEQVNKLTEAFNSEQKETAEKTMQEMSERLDDYVSYVAQTWLDENKIAIEGALRIQIAEETIKTLASVLGESMIILNPERVDAVARLEEEVKDLEERTNTLIRENRTLSKNVISERMKNIAESKITDLAESQKEKIRPILESCETEDEINSKVSAFKESFVSSTNKKTSLINEDFSTQPETIKNPGVVSKDERVNSIAKMI